MLKLQSVFSEEELDGDTSDTDELGFTNHITVEMTVGNEESSLLSHFTELYKLYKLQCFKVTRLTPSFHILCCGLTHTDDMEKLMIVHHRKTLIKKASH